MTSPKHIYETLIKAPVDRVWETITDPEYTRRYFFETALESSLEPGSAMRYVLPNGDTAIEGVIEDVETGRRLVMTWRVLYDPELEAEPPSRVEWMLAPASDDGSVTRVTLRHFDLGMSPATWANVKDGWITVLDGMKTLIETGDELGTINAAEVTPTADVDREHHRGLAVAANNSAWDLFDGRELNAGEIDDLLGRVYAAAYHWQRATSATSIQAARAAFMCSHAHAVAGHGEMALDRAHRCRALTEGAGGDALDFDHGYALVATARALACLGQTDEALAMRGEAQQLAIADAEDREIYQADVDAGPWFGI